MAGRSILRPSGSLQALPSIPPRLCVSPAACANDGGERRPQNRLSAWCNQNGHFVARQHLNGWALDSAAFELASGVPLYTPAPVHIACSLCGRWRRAQAAGPPLVCGATRMAILSPGSTQMAGRSILRPSGSLQALPSIPPRLCVSPAACAAGGGERKPQNRLSAWCNQNGHFVAR
eukprot:scaffold9940_cov64-Phaeocystis_antarctica.AAC.4